MFAIVSGNQSVKLIKAKPKTKQEKINQNSFESSQALKFKILIFFM
jgi:hypothetical protein